MQFAPHRRQRLHFMGCFLAGCCCMSEPSAFIVFHRAAFSNRLLETAIACSTRVERKGLIWGKEARDTGLFGDKDEG
jgi:hypothetical protein